MKPPLPLPLVMALQRDFPDVDVHAEIARIRKWQAKKRQPVRNWSGFLRTWLSNAVRVRAAHAAAVAPTVQPEPPAFRTFSEAEKERSRTLVYRALDALRGHGTFSPDAP